MRVLVTGGSGFLGQHVVRRLARDHEVFTAQRRIAAPSGRGVHDLELDLARLTPEDLAAATDGRLDVVFHLAARLDNPFGVDHTLAELASSNVVGTLRLLEASAALGIGRFVHGSTGGVGRNPPAGGRMREDDPAGPVNPYGLTKHLAEQAVGAYRWPFERVSLRYFTPYGRAGSNPMFRHLISAIEQGEAIVIGAGGGVRMNPIHVDDAVDATIRAIDAARLPAVLNVAGPDVVSMAELTRLLAAALGRTAVIREGAELDESRVADIELMSRHLGVPRIGIAEGIQREWGRTV
jgi:nucleoside-diphosphate-sugar epimerase